MLPEHGGMQHDPRRNRGVVGKPARYFAAPAMRTTAALALLFCTACMRTPLTDKQAYLVASGELETGNRPVIRTPAESAGDEPES